MSFHLRNNFRLLNLLFLISIASYAKEDPLVSANPGMASPCLVYLALETSSTTSIVPEALRASRQDTSRWSAQETTGEFEILFDGTDLDKWTGNTTDYIVEDGVLVIYPDRGGKGDLFTKEEFSDFIFQFEFQ